MVIREGEDSMELTAVDWGPAESPSAGDVELSVAVASAGFTGHGFTWVAADRLSAFLDRLSGLEECRRGEAVLEGMSPDEFRLRVWSVNRRGHMAIGGRVTRRVYGAEESPYCHALEFAFEFDPTRLPEVLAGFRNIAQSSPGYDRSTFRGSEGPPP
jgi:hypothetical protein